MIVLPSGLVVGITSERARYHATRQGIRVSAETPVETLWRLVDVVYLDGDPEGPSRRHRFTGHTLAEGGWLARWKAADRAAFRDWLQRSEQRREIEGARRKIIYDTLPQGVLSHPAPERLFSVLRRRVMAMETAAAPAAQWRNTLLNLTREGLREEELRWSGVLDFLDGEAAERTDKINREEVISRIDFSPLRLELTTELIRDLQPRLPFNETAALLDCRELAGSGLRGKAGEVAVVRHLALPLHYRVGYLKAPAAAAPCRWFALDPYGRAVSEPGDPAQADYPDAAGAMAAAARHARHHYGLRNGMHPSDKYAFMTLHGGEAYREWLLTLPEYAPSHFTPHFTERNVLLHFRTKERRDLDGKRLLHIEEIQSDWHQQAARAARGHPWRTSIPRAPFTREWPLLALKLILIHAVERGCAGLSWTPGAIQQLRFQSDAPALARLYDRDIPRYLARLARPWEGRIGTTRIATREPWISAWRSGAYWSVRDKGGRFTTRKRLSKEQAVALCDRHSRRLVLEVPRFLIPQGMRERIATDGLPRFGERFVEKARNPLHERGLLPRPDAP
ncbi:hypothetical protein [Endothiovibrio diazotrophicus]